MCRAWALQGYGAPIGVYLVYAIKIGLYVLGWALFCRAGSPAFTLARIAEWWMEPVAFQKAILWSLLFEVIGLGCGSGPLTGRYMPPLGGALYFLRPGTTKMPMFPGLPVIGGRTRSVLDALLYLALLVCSVVALVAPAPALAHLLPIAILVPVLGVLDKTLFLAARGEHYWVVTVAFAATANWIPAAKIVQLALWFFAGFSKLNHHFPTVSCVMTSNGPFTRAAFIRRAMYRDYPNDLRPSRLAVFMAHGGTLLEFAVPIAFLATPLGTEPTVAIVLMLGLHGYITSNVPMGVPLEWNVVVVYSGFALFWAHPDVSVLSVSPTPLAAFVVAMSIGLPILGNLFPEHISFLLAMRYYAGNWAYSIWLFRGDSYRKLAKLKMSSPWVYDQLARFYDRATAVGLVGKVVGFRMMHLHGRALCELVPKAVDRVEDYEWMDGEIVAGLVLGWNFGEGHLHQEQLLESVQAQCAEAGSGFDEGELRCIFVESQPFGRGTMAYRIADAKTGVIERGQLSVRALRAKQPWDIVGRASAMLPLLLGSLLVAHVARADDDAAAVEESGACDETIVPDRPGATDNSGVVGPKCFELESSIAFARDPGVLSMSFPQLVRVGLSPNLELAAGYEVVAIDIDDIAGVSASPADSYFRLKLNAIEADGRRPGVGAEVAVSVPGDGASIGTVDPSAAILFDWEFVDRVAWAINPQWSIPAAEAGVRRSSRFGFASVLGWSPPVKDDWLNVYIDTSGGAALVHGNWEQEVGAGAAFLVRPNIQLDASFSVVVTGDDHTVSFGPGFAWQL